MKQMKAELLLDARAALGEGPVWREAEQALYWVDIIPGVLHRTTGEQPGGQVADRAWQAPMPLGCFAFSASGRVLAAGANGFGWLELRDDKADFAAWVDPEADKPSNRFNDGKCDPNGRFLAGSMASRQGDRVIPGAFYSLEADGRYRTLIEPVGTSNGLAFSADHQTLYYIDTQTMEIAAFAYDLANGSLADRRVVRAFTTDEGRPDGMTIDNDGYLWVAFFGGGKVRCIRPSDGATLAQIDVPALNITSCCFGGADYGTLFITTARIATSPEQLQNYPHAGGIFAVRPGAYGRAFFDFAGEPGANR